MQHSKPTMPSPAQLAHARAVVTDPAKTRHAPDAALAAWETLKAAQGVRIKWANIPATTMDAGLATRSLAAERQRARISERIENRCAQTGRTYFGPHSPGAA